MTGNMVCSVVWLKGILYGVQGLQQWLCFLWFMTSHSKQIMLMDVSAMERQSLWQDTDDYFGRFVSLQHTGTAAWLRDIRQGPVSADQHNSWITGHIYYQDQQLNSGRSFLVIHCGQIKYLVSRSLPCWYHANLSLLFRKRSLVLMGFSTPVHYLHQPGLQAQVMGPWIHAVGAKF